MRIRGRNDLVSEALEYIYTLSATVMAVP